MASTSLDWERHKEVMRALYLDEDRALKDVVDIMKGPPYHFSATKKQYERQFQKKWRFRKNLTKQEWRILHFKVSKRQNKGKRTKVFVDGRLQQMEKLEHEISRYGLNKSAIFEFEPGTPERICVRSPTPDNLGTSSGTVSQTIGFVKGQGNSGFLSLPAAASGIANSGLVPVSSQVDGLPYIELSKLFDMGFRFPHDQLVSLDTAGLASFVILPDGPGQSGKSSSQGLDTLKRATFLEAVLPPAANTASSITNNFSHTQDALVQLITNGAYILYNGFGSSELGALMIQLLTLSENRRVLEHLMSSPSIAVEALVEQLLLSLLDAGNDQAAVELLHQGKISPHGRYLTAAAQTGCLETVDVLLQLGVDPNSRPFTQGRTPSRDRTPLEVSVAASQNSIAKRLVDYGADPNELGHEKRPRACAFVNAISTGNSDLLDYFLYSPTCQNSNDNVHLGHKVLWLVVAAEKGNIGMVKTLQSHVDINHHTPDGCTALAAAAFAGKYNVVSFLLQSGASPNRSGAAAKHNLWLSPLQAAIGAIHFQRVDRGDIDTIRLLIEYGADPNEAPSDWDDDWTKVRYSNTVPSRTAIQYAAEIGHEQLFFFLLNHGADPYAPAADRHGVTALQAALRSQSQVLWDFFSSKPGCLNAPPTLHAGTTALIEAIKAHNSLAIRHILYSGCDVNDTGTAHAGCTALSEAILIGDIALVRTLLVYGAEINHTQARYDGGTGLQAAIWTENSELVEILIALGADVVDDKALSIAVSKSSTNIFNILHSKIDARMFYDPTRKIRGNLALHAAIQLGDESIVLKLVQLGMNLNEPAMATGNENHNCGRCFRRQRFGSRWWTTSNLSECSTRPHDLCGETPLETTIRLQKREMMEILLAHGADINATPERPWGRAPLQCATECGNVTIVQFLLDRGADCNTAPAAIGGATALQIASIKGYIGIAQMLLDYGADPNAPRAKKHGLTALEGAADYGRLDMLQLLLDAGAFMGEPGSIISRRILSFAYKGGHMAAIRLLKTHQSKTQMSRQTDVE